jgi:acyl-CoA thioesterase I
VIALGTNDSRDLSGKCVPNAVASVSYMSDRARQCYGPSVQLLLVGPPNLNKSALGPTKPVAKEREANLRALDEAFRRLATEKQCAHALLFGKIPESSMTKDGVHPDAKGYEVIARELAPLLIPKEVMERTE